MNIASFIKRHPVLSYFVLTFVISWGGVLILGGPSGMPATSEKFAKLWPIVFVPYFLGPSLASILLTVLVNGRSGLRELLSRFLRWRVGARWWAVALLTAPLLVTAILLGLSLTSPAFLPGIFTTDNRVGLLLSGLVVGLVFGGFLEELGWTGFVVPRMRQRYGILSTGLIVGFLWALWHFLPTFWGSGDSAGKLSLSLLLPPCLFYVGVLPAFRVLMVWVYERSGESLLVGMFMHASLTASALFILAPSVKGVSLMIYYLILTAALGLIVAAVVRAKEQVLAAIAPRTGGMKIIGRIMLTIVCIPLGAILILLGVVLARSPGRPPKALAGSISEKTHVLINGVQQGMFIEGRDIGNPVLLFLHGGTAMPEYFLAQEVSYRPGTGLHRLLVGPSRCRTLLQCEHPAGDDDPGTVDS